MNLLLDTCTFLWFISGDGRLPESLVAAIREPANDVWLSAVSVWEGVVKHGLGKLALPEEPGTYLPRQRQRHGIDPLPLAEGAVAHLPKLPALHRDPFDRMLICQALEHQLCLATPDPLILAYPVKCVWEV